MFHQIKSSHAGTIINKKHKPSKPGYGMNWGRTPHIGMYQGEQSILFIQIHKIRNPMTFC
jgi:hypothetical protein